MAKTILEVKKLTLRFFTKRATVHAVENVTFCLEKGEMLGIVGESGSGKTALCNSILRTFPEPPGKIIDGEINFFGNFNSDNSSDCQQLDITKASNQQMQSIRGNKISMVFQDPMTSLNPYLQLATQLSEVLIQHKNMNKADALKKSLEVLREVNLPEPEKKLYAYPHELSGGMRQRVIIAMAILTNPEIILADEPTTALDVSIQAQILTLLKKLQRNYGTSIIFITHDLALAGKYCDNIAVMYAGKIVESAPAREVFKSPEHPYTKALIKATPRISNKNEKLFSIPGVPPNLTRPMPGCSFATRFGVSESHPDVINPTKLKKIGDRHFVEEIPESLKKIFPTLL